MEYPLPHDAVVRPWRRATILATAVAAVELVLLVVAGIVLIAPKLSSHVQAKAESQAAAPVVAKKKAEAAPAPPAARPKPERVGKPKLARGETSVLVLNGNGRTGAAALEATLVRSRGYPVTAIGDAKRRTFPRTIVMYRPGLRPEGLRLGKDLGGAIVSPLDGMKPRQLQGAELVVIVGRD